jgi:hypothetical protein
MPEKPRSAKPAAGSDARVLRKWAVANVGHPTFFSCLSPKALSADLLLVGMGEVPKVTVSLCALYSGAVSARAVSLTPTEFWCAARAAPSEAPLPQPTLP